ncbi:hypothetical protein [Helicobacter rodentium]|uniref:hypothetical protein n=1 Tax=Helicobacter rodentium TaxID=59617 RepID=UPI002356F8E8|nr:hypothetical protein [Helicobacter rodentium]
MDIYFLCDFLAIIQNFGIFTQFALLSLRDFVLAESWQSIMRDSRKYNNRILKIFKRDCKDLLFA